MSTGEARAREILAAGRLAWPGVGLDEAVLRQHLARRAHLEGGVEHVADLYLACALSVGDERALAALERQMMPAVRAALQRRGEPAEVDEVLQALRENVLVARGGGRPRIAEYEGRGSLVSWLRTVAIRTALNLRRRDKETPASDEDHHLELVAAEGPELDYIKRHHRADVVAAIQAALQELSRRDRTVVRLHVLDGLTLEEIAKLYHVNRSSVSRWIASSRQALLESVRARLAQRLRVPPAELSSLLTALRSQLDLSLERILATQAGEHRSP